MRKTLRRRGFIVGLAAKIATPAVAGAVGLRLTCIHTGRSCRLEPAGGVSPEALAAFTDVTRDWRKGVAGNMDPALLGLLFRLHATVGGGDWDLISGYRTPATNAALPGTETRSYHIRGQALDLRHSFLSTAELQRAALGLKSGGVGRYDSSRFVHVDTGPVRRW